MMKNYFIGFILVLISLFSFSNNVSAKEKTYSYNENYIQYLKDNLNFDYFKNKTNELINYIESNTNYDFIISFYMDNNYPQLRLNVIFFDDIDNILIGANDYDSNTLSFELTFKNINNNYFNYKNLDTGFDFKDINDENIGQMFLDMKVKIDDFILKKDFSNHKEIDYFSYIRQRYDLYSFDLKIPLYSTKNLLYDNNTKYNNEINIQFNDYLFTNNSTLNELIDNFNVLNSSKIILSKTYANDLEGNDIYNIRADFVDIYDKSYKYEFKTKDSDWVDITNYINDTSIYGYYIYDYVTYSNDVISFRVLDSNNNVIDENSIEISELSYDPVFPLEGYKKVTIPAGYQSAIISGIKSGRVYWVFQGESSKVYSSLYYDNSKHNWGSIEFPIQILERSNITLNYYNPNSSTWFTYQDFDITQVEKSEFILLQKYHYLEGYDTYSVDYFIPENAYFSLVKVNENDIGGNDFDYEWKDPDTGEVNNGSQSSSSNSNHNSFFSDFNNALDYFKDSIIGIFREATYFFNNLPIVLKYFFMVIFVLILFIFLIRFIL